jgi:hypothetical protein
MGEESEDLARHIENRRNRLNDNIGELERKAKDALDWRVQVERRPGTMLGLAFGAGILLSAILGGSGSSTRRKPVLSRGSHGTSTRESVPSSFQSSPEPVAPEKAMAHAWDNIKGALVGVAVTKCENFLEDLLPGITEQYHKAEARNSSTGLVSPSKTVN